MYMYQFPKMNIITIENKKNIESKKKKDDKSKPIWYIWEYSKENISMKLKWVFILDVK